MRESQKTSGKKAVVEELGGSTMPLAGAKPVVVPAKPTDTEHIISLRASGPTNEKNLRIEICARTQTKVRLFITTVFVEKCPRHSELLAEMSKLVQTGTATKADLLALKPTFAPQ